MILTAHQPGYLPWLGLFHKVASADTYVYMDNVQFETGSFANRNKIKTANGETWLTVPVLKQDHLAKTFRELKTNPAVNWQKKHWSSIRFSYAKAPFFKQYADFFEDVYKREWVLLADLNEFLLHFLLKELKIKVAFVKASDYDFSGRKSDLLIDMCEKLQADTFIFGQDGSQYADQKTFADHRIEICFQSYRHPVYPQLWGAFKSHLSVIDLLFNVGPAKALDFIMAGGGR